MRLNHKAASAFIESETNNILNHGFSREEIDLHAGRDSKQSGGISGLHSPACSPVAFKPIKRQRSASGNRDRINISKQSSARILPHRGKRNIRNAHKGILTKLISSNQPEVLAPATTRSFWLVMPGFCCRICPSL